MWLPRFLKHRRERVKPPPTTADRRLDWLEAAIGRIDDELTTLQKATDAAGVVRPVAERVKTLEQRWQRLTRALVGEQPAAPPLPEKASETLRRMVEKSGGRIVNEKCDAEPGRLTIKSVKCND